MVRVLLEQPEGIGPAYVDKYGRCGIRIGGVNEEIFKEYIKS